MDRIPPKSSADDRVSRQKETEKSSEEGVFSTRKGKKTDASNLSSPEEPTNRHTQGKTLKEHLVKQLNTASKPPSEPEWFNDSDSQSSGISSDILSSQSSQSPDPHKSSIFWGETDSEESSEEGLCNTHNPQTAFLSDSFDDSDDGIFFEPGDDSNEESIFSSSGEESLNEEASGSSSHEEQTSSGFSDEESGSKTEHPAQAAEHAGKRRPSRLKLKLVLGSIPSAVNTKTEVIVDSKEVDVEESGEQLKVVRHISREDKKIWITRSRSVPKDDEDALEIYEADHQEAELLKDLKSPYIIGIEGFEASETRTEYITSLHMQDGGVNATKAAESMADSLSTAILKQWAEDLARGLAFLREHKVMHRDIKPGNLLVHPKDGKLRIADLGNAFKYKDAFPKDPTGTGMYAAPETLRGEQQGFEADIYSAGMSLISMFMDAGLIDLGTWQEFYKCREEQRPIPLKPEYQKDEVARLLVTTSQRMTSKDPQKRPSAEELVHIFSAPGAISSSDE